MRTDLSHFTGPRPRASAEDIPQQLRALPSELPAPYDWEEFRRRSRNRFPSKTSLVQWPHAAAAAGLTAFIAAMAMLGTGGQSGDDIAAEPGGLAVTASSEVVSPTDAAEPAGRTVTASSDVVPSDAAEPGGAIPPGNGAPGGAARQWLARQPPEPAVVRVGPHIAVAALEDRIAWFDDALTDERLLGVDAEQVSALQRERARLVSSLAHVRYAESLVADGS